MSRTDEVFALFVDANPVPDVADLDVDRVHVTLLVPELEGSHDMQTIERPTPTPGPPRERRKRRWVISGLAAAAAIVAVIVIVASLGGDDESGLEVVGQPDAAESAAVAAPLDVVDAFIDLYESGNPEGWPDVVAADAKFSCPDRAITTCLDMGFFDTRGSIGWISRDSHRLYALGGELQSQCEQLATEIVCRNTETNPLVTATGSDTFRWNMHFGVEDGVIVSFAGSEPVDNGRTFESLGLLDDYEAWLEATYPAEHSELFASGAMVVTEPAQRDRHRALFLEYVDTVIAATTGTTTLVFDGRSCSVQGSPTVESGLVPFMVMNTSPNPAEAIVVQLNPGFTRADMAAAVGAGGYDTFQLGDWAPPEAAGTTNPVKLPQNATEPQAASSVALSQGDHVVICLDTLVEQAVIAPGVLIVQ